MRYGVEGSEITQTLSVPGGDTTKATISGLNSFTNYSIEVAAVNNAGYGVYSNSTTERTIGEYYSY